MLSNAKAYVTGKIFIIKGNIFSFSNTHFLILLITTWASELTFAVAGEAFTTVSGCITGGYLPWVSCEKDKCTYKSTKILSQNSILTIYKLQFLMELFLNIVAEFRDKNICH